MKALFTAVFSLAVIYSLFSQPCLPDGIWFLKQNQIDSFHIKYPGCTRIGGRVTIDGSIKNLHGLIGLKSIDGSLQIYGNDSLTDLSGLDSLTSINGYLSIEKNTSLTSLAGLENLQADSLTDLSITGNSALSACSFSGICSWLSSPNGVAKIYYNAPGCDNVAEIANGCGGSCPCLPKGNYYFLSQDDVDSFPLHYSECTHLEGDVTIIGDDITNLHGLNGIVEIAGSLMIGYSSYLMPQGTRLTNLAGLGALSHVQGGVKISYNNHLKNLSGIYGLISTEYLTISNNDSLESIAGLSSLQEVGNYFHIIGNRSMTILSGMDSLKTVGGDFWIRSNDKLTDIQAFSSLPRTYSTLEIASNPSLVRMHGFNKLKEAYVLHIHDNDKLNSLAGLNSLRRIQTRFTLQNNPALTSLSGLESLGEVNGDMTISRNYALRTLTGLDSLKSVKGRFEISRNDSLVSLNGLKSLEEAGMLTIYSCPGLDDLKGLDSLKYCADGIGISSNQGLTRLDGLEGLTSFDTVKGAYLMIYNNPALTDISAIGQLNPETISKLFIENDSLLSYCAISNLCRYLRSPGSATIRENGDGCGSREEIIAACDSLPVENLSGAPCMQFFPNPVSDHLSIVLQVDHGQITILDLTGREVLKQEITGQKSSLDTASLPGGVYLMTFVGKRAAAVGKLIKF